MMLAGRDMLTKASGIIIIATKYVSRNSCVACLIKPDTVVWQGKGLAILPAARFLVFISTRGWVNPRAIVWMERLGKLETYPVTTSGFEPATFLLVA
jgi:hypothetical protein